MNIRYEINPAYAHHKAYEKIEQFINELAQNGVPSDAKCIYAGRNHLYTRQIDDLVLNIKSFRVPSFPNSFIYTNLRKSKARRSYEYAIELLKRGIATPEPVAWIEVRKGAKLYESYYVSIQSAAIENLREWEKRPADQRDELLEAYANFMLKLHEAGILHHDLSPGNVLWQINPNDHTYNFEVVDLNRMTIRNRPLTSTEVFSNFRNINDIESETERLGRIYGKVRGMDPDQAGKMALQTLRAERRRKARLHSLKHLFKK